MIRVKIIEEDYRCDLENKVNAWLKENSDFELVDIKYSGKGYSVPYGFPHYSAMIIYKVN